MFAPAGEGTGQPDRMRIAICWHHWSGYMAACWRELSKRPGVELLVLAEHTNRPNGQPVYDPKLLDGVNARLLSTAELNDSAFVLKTVRDWNPQAVGLCGWHLPALRNLATSPAMSKVRFVMGMDTHRKGTLRQAMGRYVRASYFKRIERVIVASERTWQLALDLGFKEPQLRRGFYAIDTRQFEGVLDRRLASPNGWPRQFLYVGRYIPEKAIDVLCGGYARYRDGVSDPWPLVTCGEGPEGHHIKATKGAEDRGYLQPYDLPDRYAETGVFVIASRYEPWGVVLAEAAYSGLPILCTEACGASLDVVRSFYNGQAVTTGDPAALARGMQWMHANQQRLPELGRRSRSLAGAYTAEVWAERWETVFRELVN